MSRDERGPKGSVRFDAVLLRSARHDAKLTQEQLSEYAHLSVDSIKRAERGALVALETAWAIASCLRIQLKDLLAFANASGATPTGQSGIFHGVPPPLLHFTGRIVELDRIHSMLMRGKSIITQDAGPRTIQAGRVAICGIGGVGKTSLAAEYAYRYRDHYAGVFWCPAERRVGLLTSLAEIAVGLGWAPPNDHNIEKAARAALWRLEKENTTYLLIYDSVSDPGLIADLLPTCGACVLLTSHVADCGAWAKDLPLEELPLTEAAAFLQNRADRQDGVGAHALALLLGGLPLALDHAAAYCKLTRMHFADYATKVESLIRVLPPGTSYPRSVAATFNIAIDTALAVCAAVEPLVAYLAHCAPERIPTTLIEGALVDDAERSAALLVLAGTSLVKYDPFEDGTESVTIHRLVQAVARSRTTDHAAGSAVTRRLSVIYPMDAFDNPSSWTLCARLLPHLAAAYPTNLDGDLLPWGFSLGRRLHFLTNSIRGKECRLAGECEGDLFRRAASYLRGRGLYKQAMPLLVHAQVVSVRTLGRHPSTAKSCFELGLAYMERDDFWAAEFHIKMALRIFSKHHALSDVANCLFALADVFECKSDYAGSRRLQDRAFAIAKDTYGPNDPRALEATTRLAHRLANNGEYKEAQQLYNQALKISLTVFGPEHTKTAAALANLATFLHYRGELIEAQKTFERASDIFIGRFGAEHPHTARFQSEHARLLTSIGQFDKAITLGEAALATLVEAHGWRHPHAKKGAFIVFEACRAAGREASSLVSICIQ
jgi:tetratricopeptide (TPR) repeat protein/DNA-binding XRE family transcriptional regulator